MGVKKRSKEICKTFKSHFKLIVDSRGHAKGLVLST